MNFEEPPIFPSNTYYSREKIIEEVKNYNIEQGSFEDFKKQTELKIVFVTYVAKHTSEESINLILELFEINAEFVSKWYSNAIYEISKDYRKGEGILYELEKILAEKILFKPFFKEDEHIITHFKGVVNLPRAHLEFKGHIYLTNYQLIFPNVPRAISSTGLSIISGINGPVLPWGSIIGAGIGAVVKSHIKEVRNAFIKVFKLHPDMFYIKNPYNIELKYKYFEIKFTSNFSYEDEYSRKINYKHMISIKMIPLRETGSIVFKQKKREVFNKFVDFFSQLPNTTCHRCSNVQDKSLEKCEKCGKKMNVTIKIK